MRGEIDKDMQVSDNIVGENNGFILSQLNFSFREILLFLALNLIYIVPIYAASFDCSKANNNVEKIICSDSTISKLDNDLNIAYVLAAKSNDFNSITTSQYDWIKERNLCKDKNCIIESYNQRINELTTHSSAFMRHIRKTKVDLYTEKTWKLIDVLNTSKIANYYNSDVWGLDLPKNTSVWGIYQAKNGDIVVGLSSGKNKKYKWLDEKDGFRMISIFTENVWKVSGNDNMFYDTKVNNGNLESMKNITCPVPLPTNDPDGRDSCNATIDYKFQNGNRLLYVHTYSSLKYCYQERYGSYLVLLDINGRILHRVTPIYASSSHKYKIGIGGKDDEACRSLPGGDMYKEIEIMTHDLDVKLFLPLHDDTFVIVLKSRFDNKEYFIRLDQNFNSKNPIINKYVFFVNTNLLEKIGSLSNYKKLNIHNNAINIDSKIYNFLKK